MKVTRHFPSFGRVPRAARLLSALISCSLSPVPSLLAFTADLSHGDVAITLKAEPDRVRTPKPPLDYSQHITPK